MYRCHSGTTPPSRGFLFFAPAVRTSGPPATDLFVGKPICCGSRDPPGKFEGISIFGGRRNLPLGILSHCLTIRAPETQINATPDLGQNGPDAERNESHCR